MQRTGFSPAGGTCCWKISRPSRSSAGYEQRMWRMGPSPRSNVRCRLVFARRSLGILRLQPDLLGNSSRSGRKRGPSTGVRVSAKRQQTRLFLSPEQVKLGLAKLEFQDQLLVFLDGALGTRRGELGVLRWSDCNFESMTFSIQHRMWPETPTV
jgi:integrase